MGAVSGGGWNRAGAGAAAAHSVRWTYNLAWRAPVYVHRDVVGAHVSASALIVSCVRAELDYGARRERSLYQSDRPAPPPQDWNVVTNPLASFFRQGEGARGDVGLGAENAYRVRWPRPAEDACFRRRGGIVSVGHARSRR